MTNKLTNDRRCGSDRLTEADKECLWHPFTPMRQWLAADDEPGRVIVAGDGFELIDARGRRFIDGYSSLWCNLHGHRVAAIDRAIEAQLKCVAHCTLLGSGSAASIELAERLAKITPDGLTRVFYSDSGATAVEVALKMAYQYWHNRGQSERRKFMALRQGYHGDTIGAMSVGGIDAYHGIFQPLLFEATLVDCPNSYRHRAGDRAGADVLAQIDAELTECPGEYCAMIMEPLIQAAGGMLTHPAGFLASVRDLTSRHDVLLIVDEVATGFCRTGKLFACDHEAVTPDLMCLGKGLTGGYLPIAATMATDEIFQAFCSDDAGRTFFHGHTFTGNALGCAAASASIDLIYETSLLAALPAKTALIADKLAALADHPHVGDIRQCGMMVGVELVADRDTAGRFDTSRRIGAAVCMAARDRGILVRPLGDVVVLMPAPAMDTATLERLLDGTVEIIDEHFRP